MLSLALIATYFSKLSSHTTTRT